GAAYGSMTTVSVQDMPFTRALRVTTAQTSANAWDIRPRCFATQPARQGDTVLIAFWMRLIAGGTDGLGLTSFVVEKGADPYTKSITYTTGVGAEWKQFAVPFTMLESYDGKTSATSYNISFWVTFNPQVVEIGGISMLDYGPGVSYSSLSTVNWPYPGHEPDAPWRQLALQRIQKYRKAPIAIVAHDADGNPVPNVPVHVAMKRHLFGFGSAIDADLIAGNTADARTYRDTILANFNRIVFENDLKWPGWENQANRARTMQAFDWLAANGISFIRGHNLVWPGIAYLPSDVQRMIAAAQADQLRQRIDSHITDEVGTLAGRIAEWDVLNEPYTNRDVQKVLGDHEMAAWFKLARQSDPAAKLYVNDYNIVEAGGYDLAHQNGLADIVNLILADGGPLDGIGLQSHFDLNMTAPERVWRILDRFAAFRTDLAVTEFDVTANDEQLQADYTRDYLTTVFAHPAIKSFLMWGFWQGRHWKPDDAMYRLNWDLKPNGQAWRDLVFRQWWTDVEGATGPDGVFSVLGGGFLGDYEVTVSGVSSPLHLSAAGQPVYVLSGRQNPGRLLAVTNAASFTQGAVAPGELVTLWGQGIGPSTTAAAQYDFSGSLPDQLGNTKVWFDDVAAPIVYASASQVSAVVPYSVSRTTAIQVEYLGTRTAPLSVPVANAAPGIYGCPGAPLQPVIVQGSLRGSQSSCDAGWTPVPRGTPITLFVTGEGQTTPAGTDGALPPSGSWPAPAQPALVRFGDLQVAPEFAGLVYAGVLQVNVVVPPDATTGNIPLTVTVGGVPSQAGTVIAVR
ncbi:MAG: endo-1,4-beta-xylanase, partial [Tepidisphaerales bacterium]